MPNKPRRKWRPKTFLPRREAVDQQCENCPFRPKSRTGTPRGRAEIRSNVALGHSFHCHKTVYTGEIVVSPIRPESEWRECLGALKYRERVNLSRRRQVEAELHVRITDHGQ